MITFKSLMYSFKEPLELGSTDHKLEWEYTGNPDDILIIRPDCGCTANCTKVVEDGVQKIVCTYNETVGNSLTDEQKNGNPSGKFPFRKNIYLSLNDGKDSYVLNDAGYEVFNPDKEQIILGFNGWVKFK